MQKESLLHMPIGKGSGEPVQSHQPLHCLHIEQMSLEAATTKKQEF